ncbi:MAG: hypothetical protein Q4P32_09920 [Micrococcales bacterium]|nr:hypothetical protein [Micrococcales bacterium]
MMTRTGPFDLSALLHAASLDTGRFVTGETCWLNAGPAELDLLWAADRELVHIVTGERLPRASCDELAISFFAWQFVADRACGALVGDPSIAYVESVFSAYDGVCIDGNPMSGDLFDLALAFLVGRDLARLDPDIVSTY